MHKLAIEDFIDPITYGPLRLIPYAEGNDLFIERYKKNLSRLYVDPDTGHMQFHPMPGPEIMDDYYNGIFTRGAKDPDPAEEFVPHIIDEVRALNDYVREVSNFSEKFTVHDIGCGYGAYVWAWQQLGFIATGNEANRKWVTEANLYCNNSLSCEPLAVVLKNLDHKVDYFFTCHVLEHVTDPLSILQTVSDHMSDRSVLTIRVPNNQCFRVLCAGKRTGQDYLNGDGNAGFPMHLHFFTAKSLAIMLHHVGLEPVAVKTGVFDEVPQMAADPTWPQKIVHNMLGGEIWISACKPENRTAKRMRDIDGFIDRAVGQFAFLRRKQAENGLGIASAGKRNL